MASIKQLDERRYKITVSNGYRPNGKKISKAKTIQVPPGVPKRGIGQYVVHAAEELERSFKTGYAEDGGVETLFRDSTAKWEGDDLTRQRAMLVGGKCFLVTSVFPGGASATPTDKLLRLIDTKLEREHHEQ